MAFKKKGSPTKDTPVPKRGAKPPFGADDKAAAGKGKKGGFMLFTKGKGK